MMRPLQVLQRLRRLGLPALCLLAGAAPPGGEWVGTYICAQGPTGLSLRITPAPDGSLRALFHFYADPRNPGVPDGCYMMHGSFDAASGAFDLQAGAWLLQPPGFVSVDLAGQVAEGDMTGRVLGPNCTSFRLFPANVPLPLPPACRPTPSHHKAAPPPVQGGGIL